MPVGQRLRELRKARHLTQAQVAHGINCTATAYNRYENGARQPSMETLAMLAEYFDVSLDYLYGRAPLSDAALTDYEREFIVKLRTVPDSVKEDAMVFLDFNLEKSNLK